MPDAKTAKKNEVKKKMGHVGGALVANFFFTVCNPMMD